MLFRPGGCGGRHPWRSCPDDPDAYCIRKWEYPDADTTDKHADANTGDLDPNTHANSGDAAIANTLADIGDAADAHANHAASNADPNDAFKRGNAYIDPV